MNTPATGAASELLLNGKCPRCLNTGKLIGCFGPTKFPCPLCKKNKRSKK